MRHTVRTSKHCDGYCIWYVFHVSVTCTAKLLSKLESLTVAHPVEALQSIKEFIGVENFQEGMPQ